MKESYDNISERCLPGMPSGLNPCTERLQWPSSSTGDALLTRTMTLSSLTTLEGGVRMSKMRRAKLSLNSDVSRNTGTDIDDPLYPDKVITSYPADRNLCLFEYSLGGISAPCVSRGFLDQVRVMKEDCSRFSKIKNIVQTAYFEVILSFFFVLYKHE